MSERNDLTRWNRAGLTRFRYVDGNAVEYLEILRQQLVQRFVDPNKAESTWLKPAQKIPANEEKLKNETLIQRQQRLSRKQERILDMYHQQRSDWALEITRTFARACHILSEHTNAYANEGYLGTATQWDHVRRLVGMLDYHPAAPASASTKLVLEARESKLGLVKKGWQVKYKPPEGGDKVVFETLDDIEIDSALNQLYLMDWNRSQTYLSENVTWVKENGESIEDLDISSGDVGVLLHAGEGQGKVVHLADVNHASGALDFSTPGLAGTELWPEYQVKLLTGARDVCAVRINGEAVVSFDRAHGLSTGEVIAWYSFGWKFNEVVESDGKFVRLANPGILPGVGDAIYRLNRIDETNVDPYPQDTIVFPLQYENFAVRESGVLRWGIEPVGSVPGDFEQQQQLSDDGDPPIPVYNWINNDNISEIYVRYVEDQAIEATVELVVDTGLSADGALKDFIVDGAPKGFRSGDWVIGAGGGNRFALQIESIEEREDDFIIRFSPFEMDQSTTGMVISESLGSALRKIQVALDEAFLHDKTLGYFIDGHAKNLPVRAIQDIGEVYAGKFAAEATIQDLVEMSATALPGISETRLRQFKTKAEMVLRFEVTGEARTLSGNSVYSLLDSILVPATNVNPIAATSSLDRIYGPLQYTLRPQHFDRNEDRLGAGTGIRLATIPPGLMKGRTVLLECAGKTLVSEVAEIVDDTMIRLIDSVDADTFIKADTRVYANVVLAGHGESKPEKVLGSGKAMLSNQSFTLEVEGLAFTADATKSSGVAAAMDVSVDGQIWEQVSTLKDSAPGDHHYAIRMTEEGYVKILFGDGENGRRLPSASNNVRVRYRIGSGLSGNVPVAGLEQPVNPHPLIEAVYQPLPAAGGGDMEDLASLRENAPSTLLALERAVSLSDFSHLAAAQSSVWQAKAYRQIFHGGRTESVRVVVVPAGGVQSPEINEAIRSFLQKHALPGVQVHVDDCVKEYFSLSVTVRVKTDEFIVEEVEKAVTSALADHFTLKNRKLGQHLYLSEVYKVVEGIQGVENSICVLNSDQAEQVIKAGDESTVIYLDTSAGSGLTISAEEYLP